MKIESLTDLLLAELRDLLDVERQLTTALPRLAQGAFASELRDAFQAHAEQTIIHAERLQHIFQLLGVATEAKHCAAMEGLIQEGNEFLEERESADTAVLDAALIVAAQKIEHYEIAGYGSARTFAETLGVTQVARLLQQTLDEETETDRLLTNLAKTAVNLDALEADKQIHTEAAERNE